jgi:hypothetical protein
VHCGDKPRHSVGRSPWTAPGPLTRPDPTWGSGCGSGEPPYKTWQTGQSFMLFI